MGPTLKSIRTPLSSAVPYLSASRSLSLISSWATVRASHFLDHRVGFVSLRLQIMRHIERDQRLTSHKRAQIRGAHAAEKRVVNRRSISRALEGAKRASSPNTSPGPSMVIISLPFPSTRDSRTEPSLSKYTSSAVAPW